MNGNNIIKNNRLNEAIDYLICRWYNEWEYEGKLLPHYREEVQIALNEYVGFGKFMVNQAVSNSNTQLTFKCTCKENIVHNNIECARNFDLRVKYTDSGFDMDFITYDK